MMRYGYTILLLVIGLVVGLSGCSSPGRSLADGCDPVKGVSALADKANVAATKTGIDQVQKPEQRDTHFNPLLTYGAGAGDTWSEDNKDIHKRLLNAGNQANGLLIYQPAPARAGDAGPTGTEVGLLQSLRCTNAHLAAALSAKDGDTYKLLLTERAGLLDRLEACRAASSKVAGAKTTFNLDGAKSTNLGVATNKSDGETDSDAANKAKAEVVKAGAEAVTKINAENAAEYEDSSDESDADPKAEVPSTSIGRWKAELADAKEKRAQVEDGSDEAADLDATIRTLSRWLGSDEGDGE